MIRRLYDWTFSLAQSPYALWALAVVSFIESSFFPIPPDVLMIPMILARPNRAFVVALVATLASVAGAMLGYYIGAALFDTIGQPLLEFYGKAAEFEAFKLRYNDWGVWAILVAGITPFPYKVITIASGVTGMSIPVFIVASLFARAFRFFLVAALLWKFGAPIREFIERWLGLVFTALCVLLVGGFVALRFL
jgi:membrane protein YqaA with SNARE-associated domain